MLAAAKSRALRPQQVGGHEGRWKAPREVPPTCEDTLESAHLQTVVHALPSGRERRAAGALDPSRGVGFARAYALCPMRARLPYGPVACRREYSWTLLRVSMVTHDRELCEFLAGERVSYVYIAAQHVVGWAQ